MNGTTRHEVGPRPVGLSSRTILIVGLTLAVAAALGLTVYLLASAGQAGGHAMEGMHFQCERCEAAFVKTTEALSLAEKNTPPFSLRIDCPQCSAKRSCIPMVGCPNCGGYFVPASFRDPAGKHAGRVKDTCPNCLTDRDEWYREYYRKNP